MIAKREFKQVLRLFGLTDSDAAGVVAGLPDPAKGAEDFRQAFSDGITQSGVGYIADWRADALPILFFAAGQAAQTGATVVVDLNRGKPTLDVSGGDYFTWQGGKKAKANDLAAAWNKSAGKLVEVRSLAYFDESDTQVFVALPPSGWKQTEKLLGKLASRLFSRPQGKGVFAAKPRPKPKKVDWQKLLDDKLSNYEDQQERKFNLKKLGSNAYRSLKAALVVPPPKHKETSTNYGEVTDEVEAVFDAVADHNRYRDLHDFLPLLRWFRDRDTTDLATCLYARARVAQLRFLWELYYWHWWPQNVSTIPQYLPSMLAEPVHLAMAWFTLEALDCRKEAAAIAPLLELPALQAKWFVDSKQKDHGWFALARLMANGTKSPDLIYVDAVLPLLKREAWDDETTLNRALAVNFRDDGEWCLSNTGYYPLWPAPYYALMRQLNVSLPDHPLLSQPLNAKEIERTIPLIKQVDTALAAFAKLKPERFRGMRANALVPPLAETLKSKMKEHGKTGEDNVVACECHSIYLIRFNGKDGKRKEANCSLCGERYFASSAGFESILLISVTGDQID